MRSSMIADGRDFGDVHASIAVKSRIRQKPLEWLFAGASICAKEDISSPGRTSSFRKR